VTLLKPRNMLCSLFKLSMVHNPRFFSVLGAILLLSIVLSPLAFAAPSRYHLIAIGQSHAGNTYHVLGMNSSNQVVGYITTSDSSRIAYVWRNGGISLLKPLCAGGESVAQSINDSGTIVGMHTFNRSRH